MDKDTEARVRRSIMEKVSGGDAGHIERVSQRELRRGAVPRWVWVLIPVALALFALLRH